MTHPYRCTTGHPLTAPTCRVMPSSTYRLIVRSHVPVSVALTSPLSGSTAYSGALPSRSSQICFSVTHPPREPLSADSRYSRSDVAENRTETVLLGSQSGFVMALFGDEVSAATKASRLRTAAFRNVRAIVPCAQLFLSSCWVVPGGSATTTTTYYYYYCCCCCCSEGRGCGRGASCSLFVLSCTVGEETMSRHSTQTRRVIMVEVAPEMDLLKLGIYSK